MLSPFIVFSVLHIACGTASTPERNTTVHTNSDEFGLLPYAHTIELMWVQDFSASFSDDLPQIKEQLPQAIEELKSIFNHSKFGLAGFVDKPFGQSGYSTSLDYCYHLRYPLTRYTSRIKQTLNAALIHSGRDWKESQLDAIIQAISLPESRWAQERSTPNSYRYHKILALATDSGYHQAGTFPALPMNSGYGLEPCNTTDYPSVSQVKHRLEEEKVVPIFFVTRDVVPIYRNLVKLLGDNGLVYLLDEDSRNLREGLISAVHFALRHESTKCISPHCVCKGLACCDTYDCTNEASKAEDALIVEVKEQPKAMSLLVEY